MNDIESDEDSYESGHEKETNLKPGLSKKKRYGSNFQRSWLIDDQLKDWLEERDEAPFVKFVKPVFLVLTQRYCITKIAVVTRSRNK